MFFQMKATAAKKTYQFTKLEHKNMHKRKTKAILRCIHDVTTTIIFVLINMIDYLQSQVLFFCDLLTPALVQHIIKTFKLKQVYFFFKF